MKNDYETPSDERLRQAGVKDLTHQVPPRDDSYPLKKQQADG